MEAVAGILGLAQLAGAVAITCGGYILEVVGASEQMDHLRDELVSLKELLESLGELLKEEPDDKKLIFLRRRGKDIENCKALLEKVDKKLNPKPTRHPAIKSLFQSLDWPRKKKDVMERVQQISRYRELFRDAMNLYQNQTNSRIEQKLDLQGLRIAQGAELDLVEDQCFDGTREELLDEVEKWAESSQGKCVFWLSGAAGMGKSTISRTVGRRLEDKSLLGGSFCFKHGETDRAIAERLFPTLAKQLAGRVPSLRREIQNAIEEDPSISDKAVVEQFKKLLLQPLQNVEVGKAVTLVIVIDALDECQSDVTKNKIKAILSVLPLAQTIKRIKLRFFLTSRPELVVRLGFKGLKGDDLQNLKLDDVPETPRDISIFLDRSFRDIRTDIGLTADWPGGQAMKLLLKKTVPLFISAATLCRFIHDAPDPEERLQDLLEDRSDYVSQMAATYLPILKQLLVGQSKSVIQKDVLPKFRQIVGSIILLETPLSTNGLSGLLGLAADKIQRRLNQLHSVLDVPGDHDIPVRLYHLSFRDFLLDEDTRDTEDSEKFWIDKAERHQTLTKRCLMIMDGQLVKNINARLIQQHPPSELQYACRYWTQHLAQSLDPTSALNDAYSILKVHFLHWMEAMSIMGLISEVVEAVNRLQSVSSNDEQTGVSEFLHDARRFVLKNRHLAETAPSQLYSSALMFCPTSSIIRGLFASELTDWPLLPEVEEFWSAELQTLEGHTACVRSLRVSRDGQQLASCSDDGTMRLWDSATGQLQQTFSGHSSPVTSFDISHDNERIVSGSDEGVIKLWNATTGELQQTFEGHSDYVYTVVFSPDGQSIASGSADGTINIWIHTQSGPLQTLKGHSGGVDSVAFSPDGQRLVSGSMNDKTIKLWGPTMSQRTETLEEQSGSPRSVAFSPDGRQLASGSKDGTITLWILTADALLPARTLQSRGATSVAFSPNSEKLATGSDGTVELWDLRTYEVERTCVGQSRKREYAGTTSLTFSPDGRYLAFDPLDKTLRVWDLTTNDPPRILSGHARSIKSFVFLPGGQQLATASDDNTIKIWDLTAGESQQVTNEEGVPGSTKSIAFSPGGEQLATGLSDGTIKIWEPSTGKMKRRFQAHEYAVQSVAFSAEGYRPLVLASGSDTTIRLWDPQTGQKAWPLHLLLSAEVRSLCFLPDNRLVSGWNSGHITVRNIKIWNITTSQRDKTFSAHEASVESISLTEDGQMVSGSGDGTCKLWDLAAPTDQPKQVFHSVDGDFAAPLRTIAISPKDQQLAGSAPNGPTNVWNLSKNPSRQIHKRHSNWVWTSSGARISILDGQWICLNGERTLWLPKQYRAECLAVSHERIALGHPSGNVSFIMMPQARA